MEAMCHTFRERKSKSLDKMRGRKTKTNKRKKEQNKEGTCGKEKRWEEIFHLNQVGSDSVGEKEKGGKEEERK